MRSVLAYEGTAALAMARAEPPDAILLDLGLPGMSGLEVAHTLRADGQPPRLVALTGYGTAEDREKTAEAGFDLHLTKPVDLGELAHALERLLA